VGSAFEWPQAKDEQSWLASAVGCNEDCGHLMGVCGLSMASRKWLCICSGSISVEIMPPDQGKTP
jgi:hypothetical protein